MLGRIIEQVLSDSSMTEHVTYMGLTKVMFGLGIDLVI